MNDRPVAYHNLPRDQFPFTITAHRVSDGFEVWRCTVFGPGPVHIPALAKHWGEPVSMRFSFPDGREHEEPPP